MNHPTDAAGQNARPVVPPVRHLPVPPGCRRMIRDGALFAINHSGGKDSQAMTILLSRIIPHDRIVIVHAPLGAVEWPGTISHIEATMPRDVPLIMAPIASGQFLLERIELRGRFPDKRRRFCTSDFKRGPIERELRRYLAAHPRFAGRIVNCMGIRADESSDRSRRTPWSANRNNSKAGRQWFDWLPIFDFSEPEVFSTIERAGQSPHWAYAAGMTRLSCSFCILASRADLRRAAELRPQLYARYAALEHRIGHTLSPTRMPLPAVTGIPVNPESIP